MFRINMLEKRMKGLKVWDISLIKLSTFFFAFFIASLIPQIVIDYKWIWVILGILFAIKPLYKFWRR